MRPVVTTEKLAAKRPQQGTNLLEVQELLLDQPPWFVIGPAVGLVLIGLLAFVNVRMGVLGGVTDLVERASGRKPSIGWKGWFVVGIVLGGLLFHALAGARTTGGESYGWLAGAFNGSDVLIALALLLAGGLIGYGAKYAGGCTSGNGLSGVSFGSPGSMVAMATFMGTAIVTTAVIGVVT
jgi:uncharacterized protein